MATFTAMAFDLESFLKIRPKLYHLTARSNLEGILRDRRLLTAAEILERGNMGDWIRRRRPKSLIVPNGEGDTHVRDQAPLFPRNATLEGGWTFEDFIESLNRRVFFWPGTHAGPIPMGSNHFGTYRDHDSVVLVLDTAALFDENPNLQPEFCKYNSGSPRCNAGKGVPRGPQTFLSRDKFPWRGSDVKEVTFASAVALPRDGVQVEDHRRWVKTEAAT
jgi:Family of unknown function (DUF7002)